MNGWIAGVLMSAMVVGGAEFYVASETDTAEGGISLWRVAPDVAPEKMGFTALKGANYCVFSRDGHTLYSTGRQEGKNGVAAFRINPDGSLTQISFCPDGGKVGCHVAVSPDGKFLYCANYSSGDFSEFALASDGRVERLVRRVSHPAANRGGRQEAAHPHYVGFTPDRQFLCVVDLGLDAVKLYRFAPGKGIDPNAAMTVALPAGSGPRHLAFSPDGAFAYVVTELGNTLVVLACDSTGWKFVEEHRLVPAGFEGKSYASAVKFSPDRRFLFVSNRGFDSIAVFGVLPDGKLKEHDLRLVAGRYPRDILFVTDKLFAAANQLSGNVTFYSYDPIRGSLRATGQEIKIAAPLFLLPR